MRYLKPRIFALLLALTIGVGVDWYVRREAGHHRSCFGSVSWHVLAVEIADHPLLFLRVVWIKLTD